MRRHRSSIPRTPISRRALALCSPSSFDRESSASTAQGFGTPVRCAVAVNVFVHHSGIQDGGFKTLKEGQDVIFYIMQDVMGLKATNVKAP
jgi:cold shock protein